MGKILNFLKTIAFWGVFFLIIIVSLFDVSLTDGLIKDAASTVSPINLLAKYLLMSVPAFIILVIIDFFVARKNKMTLFDAISISIPALAWTPYKGLDIREIFKLKKLDMSWTAILYDLWCMLLRLIEMILWWGVLIYSVDSVNKTPTCSLAMTINQMTKAEILQKVGITALAIVILNVFGWILSKIQMKVWQSRFERSEDESKGTLGQRYFYNHPEHIPSGCSACGGPYPECRASCSMFDE